MNLINIHTYIYNTLYRRVTFLLSLAIKRVKWKNCICYSLASKRTHRYRICIILFPSIPTLDDRVTYNMYHPPTCVINMQYKLFFLIFSFYKLWAWLINAFNCSIMLTGYITSNYRVIDSSIISALLRNDLKQFFEKKKKKHKIDWQIDIYF
jgi:hypothetical protein